MSSKIEDNDEKPKVYSVAGIILNILTAINENRIDAINENEAIINEDDDDNDNDIDNDKYLEDTPVEKTLCVIWDLTGLEEYANIFMNECQIHRIMLKVKKYFFLFFFIFFYFNDKRYIKTFVKSH